MIQFYRILASVGLFLALMTTELPAWAGHVNGGYISWKFLDSNTLVYELHVFRDCRGIPFASSRTTTVQFLNRSRDTAIERTAIRTRIDDVSPMCSTEPTKCNGTGFGGSGLEDHVYSDTMVLSRFGIRNDDAIRIAFNNCCRSTAITTGVDGGNVYIYALIHQRKGESAAPRNIIFFPGSTSTVYYNPELHPQNYDSISYEWVEPMTAAAQVSFYTTPNGLPVEVYYAKGRSYPYVDIRSFPPQGFYFSETTGDMIFECPKTSLFTTIVYKIKQWTRNKGKYELNSEFLFEQHYISGVTRNQAPQLIKKPLYRLTSGVKSDILLQTYDRPVQNTNDSVTISWREKLNGATYTIKDSANKKNPALLIEWTPPAVNQVSYFHPIVNITDDNCPFRSPQQHSINIEVRNKPAAQRRYQKLRCGKLALSTIPDSANMGMVFTSWRVLTEDGGSLNTEAYQFIGRLDTSSALTEDTLQFYQSGSYIIEHQVWYPEFEYHRVYLDTIRITENFPELVSISDTFHCRGSALQLRPNPMQFSDSIQWYLNGKFKGKGPINVNPEMGRYRVLAQLTDGASCVRRDYFSLSVLDRPNADLGDDVFLCAPYEHRFNVEPAASYPWAEHAVKWNGIIGSDSNSSKQPGMFVAEVQNRCGISSDTLWVLDRSFNFPQNVEQAFCETDTLLLESPYKGIPWRWTGADSGQAIQVFRSGQYVLNLYSVCQEEKRLTFRTLRHSRPRFLMPDESAICDGQPKIIVAGNFDGYTKLLWNDSSTASVRTFTKEGEYELRAGNACGEFYERIRIINQQTPELSLPADTFFCEGKQILISVGEQKGIYRWSDGNESPERFISEPGRYTLECYNYCGSDVDTMEVEAYRFVPPFLGRDTLIKAGDFIRLEAGEDANGYRYQWNTGDTTSEILVSTVGTYSVLKRNECGEASDTIIIDFLASVNPISNGQVLKLYPNPVREQLLVEGPDLLQSKVELYNAIGQQIAFEYEILSSNQISIRVAHLPAGLYTLRSKKSAGHVYQAIFMKY